MKTNFLGWLLCVGVMLGPACTRSASEHPHGAMSSGREGAKHGQCGCDQMHGKTTQVDDVGCDHMHGKTTLVDDVEGGVALSYRASDGVPVAGLRADVAALAERINTGQQAPMHCAMHAGTHGPVQLQVAALASVDELPDGARLILKPRDPAQLQALRVEAREHPSCAGCAGHAHGAGCAGHAHGAPAAHDQQP